MAKSSTWRDLSANQLQQIRSPDASKGLQPREVLAEYLSLPDPSPTSPFHDPSKAAIALDLYISVLRFGDSISLEDDKLSGLFSIVKQVFLSAIQDRQQVDVSFNYFKSLLLAHSVQRPPFSIGLFTLAETKSIVAWMLDTFYRHYKLYMYTYTDRVVMNTIQTHPMDIVELPPSIFLPLNDAMTEEQHTIVMTEEQKKAEEEAKAQAEAQAQEIEAARLATLKEAYIAAIPDEISDQVTAAVAREVERLRGEMENQFKEQHDRLQAKVTELEAKVVVAV